MLITAALLYAYNGIEQKEDEASQQLIAIHIGTAQQIITNYVLFDCALLHFYSWKTAET